MACLYTAISRKEKVHAKIPKGIKGMEREDMDACLRRLKESTKSRDSCRLTVRQEQCIDHITLT